MNETKLDWSDLNLFLAVARGGGLASGATISGISAPTLGRHMVDLERAMGEVLFNRLPRGYALTVAGQALLIEAQIVEDQIQSITQRRKDQNSQLPIHISAGTWMTRFLTNNITDITTDNTRLVFRATELQHNIGRREATIGLRNTRPVEDGLAARKTTRLTFAPFATPTANTTDWIASTAQTPSANWVRAHKKSHIRIEASTPRTLLDLARQGAGNTVLPCFVGDLEPSLIRTGPIIPELSHDQWLVVHGEERNQPSVRDTVDLIAKLITLSRAIFDGNSKTEKL